MIILLFPFPTPMSAPSVSSMPTPSETEDRVTKLFEKFYDFGFFGPEDDKDEIYKEYFKEFDSNTFSIVFSRFKANPQAFERKV